MPKINCQAGQLWAINSPLCSLIKFNITRTLTQQVSIYCYLQPWQDASQLWGLLFWLQMVLNSLRIPLRLSDFQVELVRRNAAQREREGGRCLFPCHNSPVAMRVFDVSPAIYDFAYLLLPLKFPGAHPSAHPLYDLAGLQVQFRPRGCDGPEPPKSR